MIFPPNRIKELERENRELRQANEILKKGEPMERQWSERHWRTRILLRIEGSAASLRAMPEMLDRHSSGKPYPGRLSDPPHRK